MHSDDTTLRAEALFASLIEGGPFGYGLLDKALRIVRINGVLSGVMGLEVEVLLGEPLRDVLSADLWAQLEPALSEVLETKAPIHLIDVKLPSLARSRRERHGHASLVPVLEGDEVTAIHAVLLETTSRWRAEQALRRSTSDLQRAHELVPLGTFEVGMPSSSRETWSDGARRIFGLEDPAVPLTSQRFLDEVIHPDDREAFSSALAASVEEGAFDVEFRVLRPRGEVRHVHSVGAPVRDARGRLKKVMGMLLDVTERRQTAAALKDRELRMRAILEAAIDGILIVDESGVVESFNPAAERMFGYRADEVIGEDVLLLAPPSIRTGEPGALGAYLRVAPKLPGGRREVLGCRKDGTTFPLEVGVSEVRLADGRKYAGILRDLTEQRRLEREFLQSQKLEAIGRLASGIAHDFNNLLMGIMGCASIAIDRLSPDEPARRFIEEVKNAAARGATLPTQLLSFSRRRDVEPTLVDVNAVVDEMQGMLGRALGEAITLRIELAAGPLFASIGMGQLEQALMNLVLNGRDAMPGGGVLAIRTEDITLSAADARVLGVNAGAYVSLVVSDTGCGMDAETQAYVFEPFFTTKEVGQGTGLGLSTVYGFVHSAGGHVQIESERDQGTLVRVLLPRADATRLPSPDGDAARPMGGSETVLVVEDAPLVRLTVRDYLERGGYRVLEAADGQEALEVFHAEGRRVDLLLTDVVLPGMSGPELAAALVEERLELRVLYMSAYAPEDALPGEGARGDGEPVAVLEKPFTEESLLAVVREQLDRLSAPGGRERAVS